MSSAGYFTRATWFLEAIWSQSSVTCESECRRLKPAREGSRGMATQGSASLHPGLSSWPPSGLAASSGVRFCKWGARGRGYFGKLAWTAALYVPPAEAGLRGFKGDGNQDSASLHPGLSSWAAPPACSIDPCAVGKSEACGRGNADAGLNDCSAFAAG